LSSIRTKIKCQWLETRKTSFNFHLKFYFNAEQNEAASEPRDWVLCFIRADNTWSGRSVTYRCQNLNEISTHSKRADCGFSSSWNGLDKQSSAEPNIILNFPSDTSFKQPSLFVQAAYNLSAILVNWNGVDDVIMSVDSGLCTVARLLTGIQEGANHSFVLGMYALNSNSLAKSVVSNFWRPLCVASPQNFARARVFRPPHKWSPKLETTRSLHSFLLIFFVTHGSFLFLE